MAGKVLKKKQGKTKKHPGSLVQLLKLKEGTTESFDNTEIYYKSVGWGYPLILCNGVGVSTCFWKYFEEHFKHDFQVITWDYRGHGHSSPPKRKKHSNVHALIEDCKAVCQALKIDKGLFVGHSLGTQVALEFYRQHPEFVSGIISCFGTFGRPMDFFYNSPLSKHIFEIISLLGLLFPKPSNLFSQLLVRNPFWYRLGGILKMVNTGMADKNDIQEYVDHILSVDPRFFSKLTRSVQAHTSEDLLQKLKLPMLIIGGEYDSFTPVWLAKKMHRIVSNSELFIVRKGSHAGLVEQPELINLRVEKFIRERILG